MGRNERMMPDARRSLSPQKVQARRPAEPACEFIFFGRTGGGVRQKRAPAAPGYRCCQPCKAGLAHTLTEEGSSIFRRSIAGSSLNASYGWAAALITGSSIFDGHCGER